MFIKKMILFFSFLLIFSSCAYTQGARDDTGFKVPSFVDRKIFLNDLKTDFRIKRVYGYLRKMKENRTYGYGFRISKTGRIIADIYDGTSFFKPVDSFVKSSFNKYKWLPATKKCISCSVEAYGTLTMSFVPTNKVIEVYISVGDGGKFNQMIVDERIEL